MAHFDASRSVAVSVRTDCHVLIHVSELVSRCVSRSFSLVQFGRQINDYKKDYVQLIMIKTF